MEPLLLFTIFISFFCTFLAMPFWIKKAKQIGLVWEDMNKLNHPKNVAGSGGLIVVFGFLLGVLLYIAIRIFYFKDGGDITSYLFVILAVLLISSIVGIVDDLFGWQKGGLSAKSRLFLILFAAIPLMVINAGESSILGFELGILFPLIVIPLGVVGATTTFNFLAGYNGLEAGQGILILSALAFVTFITGNSWLSVVALCMVAALLAFYIFNKYPAKVFPGDVMTYAVGALIACIAILGNIEKIALFFFIPYLLETVLKLRGKLKKYSFAKVNEDGGLDMPYNKIYGLEHLAIKILKKTKQGKKINEKEVVYLIYGFQLIIIALGLALLL
ncbi:glycosyl transferase family 4 [Candidatus Pacearchaeota archaeon]|nr:glycosyl transferase family 4 [Candidatus Pacearchaeota archaeon]